MAAMERSDMAGQTVSVNIPAISNRQASSIRSRAGKPVRLFRAIDKSLMWTQYVHMKTVTVRDLRNNFSKVEAWLGEGEEIRIEKRGQPIGFLSATSSSAKAEIQKPDWEARAMR
jgi:hypothetical protein